MKFHSMLNRKSKVKNRLQKACKEDRLESM